MKKSHKITLTAIIALAIASCQSKDQWIPGNTNGVYRDTSINKKNYRYYNGGWYPVYHNMISPTTYSRASATDIASPRFAPVHTPIRSGGFGSSAHSFGSASA